MVQFLKRFLLKNQDRMFREARQMEGFLHLLFKQRNTARKWTKEEKKKIRGYLKRSSLYMPIMIIFLLPGGLLLLPLLAEILDRRRSRRTPSGPLVQESGSAH
jgi:hypothetical protein